MRRALAAARGADLIVKASGVGVFDALLEAAVLELRRPDGTRPLCAFWDVDAPATLERVRGAAGAAPIRSGRWSRATTWSSPTAAARRWSRAYEALGARRCVPIYNALDPETHSPAAPSRRALHGRPGLSRQPAARPRGAGRGVLPARGGARCPSACSCWAAPAGTTSRCPATFARVGHVYTRDHNAFNASTTAVLNVNRDSMARVGFSPATRVFEAAGAAACVVTDAFVGVEPFFAPDREILVARDGAEVAAHPGGADAGARARRSARRRGARVLAEHTYDQRALQVEALLLRRERPRCAEPAERRERRRSTSSSWGCRSPRRGATGTPPPTAALVGAGAPRAPVRFLERDVPWYAREPRPAEPAVRRRRRSTRASRSCVAAHADAVREADLVIVGSYVPEGIAVGAGCRRRRAA